MHLAQRAPVDCEVLSEAVHRPAPYRAMPADHSVPGNHVSIHLEIPASVLYQCIHLHERVFVEQQFNSLSGCHLAFGVLSRDASLPTTTFGLRFPTTELLDTLIGLSHGAKVGIPRQ